jgi:hypothetical protein
MNISQFERDDFCKRLLLSWAEVNQRGLRTVTDWKGSTFSWLEKDAARMPKIDNLSHLFEAEWIVSEGCAFDFIRVSRKHLRSHPIQDLTFFV